MFLPLSASRMLGKQISQAGDASARGVQKKTEASAENKKSASQRHGRNGGRAKTLHCQPASGPRALPVQEARHRSDVHPFPVRVSTSCVYIFSQDDPPKKKAHVQALARRSSRHHNACSPLITYVVQSALPPLREANAGIGMSVTRGPLGGILR